MQQERNFISDLVNTAIVPHFYGTTRLKGKITKLKKLKFRPLLKWMRSEMSITPEDGQKIIDKYKRKTGKELLSKYMQSSS